MKSNNEAIAEIADFQTRVREDDIDLEKMIRTNVYIKEHIRDKVKKNRNINMSLVIEKALVAELELYE